MATIKTNADYYKDTDYFCLYNPNPTEGDRAKKGDCVIRALAVAMGITWLEAFDLLTENARRTYNVPNDNQNYDEVLKACGFTYQAAKAEKGKKRMTVEQFCIKHPKGHYFIKIANHCTAVVDGVCYDAWNPANKTIYRIYQRL